jgi:hypothetical protein
MIDQAGSQHVTDPVTGEEVGPDCDPNLIGMMTGVIWNGQYATLTKAGGKGHSLNTVAMNHFALAVTLYPEGKDMRYETHSARMIEQWNDMMLWKSLGYVGLDREKCVPQREGIMRDMEEGNRRVQIVQITEANDSAREEASQMYAVEAVQRLEDDYALRVDSYGQPEAPWS